MLLIQHYLFPCGCFVRLNLIKRNCIDDIGFEFITFGFTNAFTEQGKITISELM